MTAIREGLRALVFISGFLSGIAISVTAGAYGGGGGPILVRIAVILVPLAMALAAPLLWVLAARSTAGDRCTLGYLAAWFVFFAVSALLVWIF